MARDGSPADPADDRSLDRRRQGPGARAAGAVVAYVVGDPYLHLSRDATETDDYGGVGFVDVPPGTYTVTGTRAETGERIGAQRIHVRANAFSLLVLAPTP